MNDNNGKIIAVAEEVAKEFIKKGHDKYGEKIMDIISDLKKINNDLQEIPEQVRIELGNNILIALGIMGSSNIF